MKHFFLLIIMLTLVTITTSCIFRPPSTIKYYDINLPKPDNGNTIDVTFPIITTKGPYRTKMVWRKNKRDLYFDDMNRWTQSPDNLLKKYLELSFLKNTMSKSKPYKVYIEILLCEFNQDTKEVIFVAKYKIKSPNGKEQQYAIRLQRKNKEINADVFADSMSEIFKEFADKIKLQIKQMNN